MHISDKLLQLLHASPLTQDELSVQLGKSWEDIREMVGWMDMWGWAKRERGGQQRYVLTGIGRAEFDRRVKQGAQLYPMKKRMAQAEEDRRRRNVQG